MGWGGILLRHQCQSLFEAPMMPTEAMLDSLQSATWRFKAYGNNPVGSSACEVVCYDVPGRESRGDRCRIRPPHMSRMTIQVVLHSPPFANLQTTPSNLQKKPLS